MPNVSTQIGSVQDVAGATVSVVLDTETISGMAFVDGQSYRIGQVGSFVRIPMGYVDQFGIVTQIGAGAVPENLAESEPFGRRWMRVQLVGEANRNSGFSRGLSQYPSIGDQVHLVTQDDLGRIYGWSGSTRHVAIGHLASAEGIPAYVDLDALLTRHSAVVGTTGAGKTTTVVSLVSRVTDPETFPSARVLILDIHGEYAAAMRDRANVFQVNPDENSPNANRPLYVPFWALNYDELLSLTLGSLDDASRAGVLEKVTDLKKSTLLTNARNGVNAESVTADTPVPFSIHRLWYDLYQQVHATHTAQSTGQSENTQAWMLDASGQPIKGEAMAVVPPRYQPQQQGKIFLSGSNLNIRRNLEMLASRLRDPRYGFLFRPGEWLPDKNGVPTRDLDDLLTDWIGSNKCITILDLSGIPGDILTTLVGALLRIVYDALFWARNLPEGGRNRPLLVVLEEAHTYLHANQLGAAASAVKRIVKEGRKYGIGAMVVSQRPAEVDSTILSQCGTLVALRLTNPTDRSHITGAVSDNLEGLLSALPILRTGEALIVGEGVQLPVEC